MQLTYGVGSTQLDTSGLRMRMLLWLAGVVAVWACGGGASWERGLYVFGAEVETFRPCGGADELWVLASPSLLAQLRAERDSLVERPYQPVYVEVRGRHQSRALDGFAADYPGQYEIDSVGVVRVAIPDDCPAPAGPPSRPAS